MAQGTDPRTSLGQLKRLAQKQEKPAASHISEEARLDAKHHLEKISEKFILAWDGSLGTESDDIMRQLASPDFKMLYFPDVEFDWPRTTSVDRFIDLAHEIKRRNPSWSMNPYNFSAVMDRELEHAVVWFTSGPSGGPLNSEEVDSRWATNRESVSKLDWMRRSVDGEWVCLSHTAIRGGCNLENLN